MDQEHMGMMGMGMGMDPMMGDWGTKKGMVGMGMMPGMWMGKHWRRFMSNDEKIGKLEEYLKELQMEEKGVLEAIAKMKMMK